VGWGRDRGVIPTPAWRGDLLAWGLGWGGVGWGSPLGIPTAPRRISNNHSNNAAAPIDMRTHGCCCPHRYAHSWLLLPP